MIKEKRGFTLVELMVVMAIIALLIALVVGAITLARQTADETAHRSNARSIQTALEGEFAKNKLYCGASPSRLTCGTFSLASAGETSRLNIAVKADCTGGSYSGGGNVVVSADAYTITPYNHNCTYQLTSDQIKFP